MSTDHERHQCHHAIRFPSAHGAPPSTPMPTLSRCCAALLAWCRDWLRGIEHVDPCLIVRLQRVQIACGMVHDGGDVLPALIRMLQAQDMPQLVQHHAAHIQARREVPLTERRLEWPSIGVPAELGIEDGRGADDSQAPVGARICFRGTRRQAPQVLMVPRPADDVRCIGLLDEERYHCRPLRKGRRGIVIPTRRPIAEHPACVAQLQADGNRGCGPWGVATFVSSCLR